MFQSRFFRALAVIAGMAMLMYIGISLFLPSPRRLIFGVDKRSGKVRLVQNHVTFLPPHQFYRLDFEKRNGMAQRDGTVQILTKERVPVAITYRIRFTLPGERLPDARRLVNEGWSAWIRTRVGEAISAVTQRVPIEELLSPTSQFAARRNVLRNVVARHLAQSGLNVTAFEIARMEPDRGALLEYKRQELRRNARGVAGRVAIFALDGADWDLLRELSNDGRIPNIRALAQGGVTASLQTIQPTVSPLVWTTAATGLPPNRHGVIDFIDHANDRPPDGATRKTPTVWEIAEVFGRSSVVVNWWAASPAWTDAAVLFDTPVDFRPDAIYPRALSPRIQSLIVPPSAVQGPQVRRFLNITQSEYEKAVSDADPHDPADIMRRVLAKTWSDHRVGIYLYQQHDPLLTMLSFEGTDIVNHLFAPYHPPYRQGIPSGEFRKYWPVVANYYAEIDRLIGEWMNVLTEDTTVMILSAHGFRWDRGRPREQPTGRSALADHRSPGVFIAYGNQVEASRASRMMSVYDVVPAVLSLLGLPKSTEMPGNTPPWLFRDVPPVTSVRVVSYDEFFDGPMIGGVETEAARYRNALQTVGHLTDPSRMQPVFDEAQDATRAKAAPIPPQQWGAYAYYNNLGIQLRREGKISDAADAFQKAISLNPSRPTPYLNLAMTLFDREQYTAAEKVFMQAVQRGLPNAEQWFVDFAALYRSQDMVSRAINLLTEGKKILPQSYLIAANLGSALVSVKRTTEGLAELERALGLQPSSTLVLNNIGIYYAKQEDYGRALDFWNRSLTIDPRQPKIREAVEAARTHL